MAAKENSIVPGGIAGNSGTMSDVHPASSPAAPWRLRLARWRKAVASAWGAPESVTLLRLDGEEVALILRRAREGKGQLPRG